VLFPNLGRGKSSHESSDFFVRWGRSRFRNQSEKTMRGGKGKGSQRNNWGGHALGEKVGTWTKHAGLLDLEKGHKGIGAKRALIHLGGGEMGG